MKRIFVFSFIIMLVSCTSMKVAPIDQKTGLFPGGKIAKVASSIPTNMDEKRSLIVVPTGTFTVSMVENIGFFDEVITVEELEERIIKNDLTDEVPAIDSKIGINKAAKAYQYFVWLHWDSRKDGNRQYSQLKLVDPLTLDEYMVAETHLDYVWTGVNDQANWYPMLNALVEYINQNSTTYNR